METFFDLDTLFWTGIIRSDIGGVTYFGSSVNTYVASDVAIEKEIFGKNFTKNERIGEIITLGMKGYWRRFWSFSNRKRTKRYMKAYNLQGDPSLNILGTGCVLDYRFTQHEVFNSGDNVTYHAINEIENLADFEILSGANVSLLAGNSINLNSGFTIESGANSDIKIEPCDNGTKKKFNSGALKSSENNEVFILSDKKSEIVNPAIFSLFPNPTNSEFSISYTIDKESPIVFELYTNTGSKIKTMISNDNQKPGNYYNHFSLEGLSDGSYFYIFKTNFKIYSGTIIKN